MDQINPFTAIILIVIGLALLYFAYKKLKKDDPVSTVIHTGIEEQSTWTNQPVPIHEPADVAPTEQPNPIVDREEAEQEKIQEIVEENKPLSEAEFVQESMVEPVEEPQSSSESLGMSAYLNKADQEADREVVASSSASFPAPTANAEVETAPVRKTSTPFVGDLTDDEVRAIRKSDKPVAELAIQYDKSVSTIRRIKSKQSYAHVV